MKHQCANYLSILVILATTYVKAENLPFLDAKVKTLVTFKDGTVFVMKEGRVKVGKSGKVVTSPISDAAFGTVGVSSQTKGVRVKMLTASAVHSSKEAELSFADARSRAHGRSVSVKRRGDDQAIKGEFLGLKSPSTIASAVGITNVNNSQDYVLSIKQSNGLISLLPMSEVEEWRFLDTEKIQRDPEKTGQHLTISLEGAKAGTEVTINYYYLWRGVRWTPSYLLERGKNGDVAVELRGEIKNDLLDLKGTKVFFVVGVPNFAFLKTPSPMVAQKSLQQVTAALQRTQTFAHLNFGNGQFTNTMSNGQMPATVTPLEVQLPKQTPQSGSPKFAPSANLPNVQSTDAGSLHLYEVGDIDLAKGERSIIMLDRMSLKCRDLVVWDLHDSRIDTASHSVSPSDRAAHPIVHYWMLQAKETPLTTGPALVVKGDVALSQDKIFYTPRHTSGRFKAGMAVGMNGSASETVLSREAGRKEVNDRQSHHHGKAFWLKKEIRWIDETRELTIKMTNSQLFETDMMVTRTFKGRPSASDKISIRTLGNMSDTEDQINQLTWKESLQPGETKEIKFRYLARVFTKK